MTFLSRIRRKKKCDQSSDLGAALLETQVCNGAILLENLVRYPGRINLPFKIFEFKNLSLATNGFNTKLEENTNQHDYYKAIIDGVPVLIKRQVRYNDDRYLNEITILFGIRHRNVMKLLGCCLDAPVPLIVSEFIPNGTLDHLIRSRSRIVDRLPWPDRLRIATGIAEALAYLHHYGQRPIIHRDVNPQNVFLDEDYNPKLGEFGLSVLKPKDKEEAADFIKTYIYLDPVCFIDGVPTEKIDVYSFGVLLLVLFFWELPSYTKTIVDEEQLGPTIFMSLLLEISGLDLNEDDVCFRMVIKNFPIANTDIIIEEVRRRRKEQTVTFLGLACRCLKGRGEIRPTMTEVVRELKRMR